MEEGKEMDRDRRDETQFVPLLLQVRVGLGGLFTAKVMEASILYDFCKTQVSMTAEDNWSHDKIGKCSFSTSLSTCCGI